MGKKTKLWFDKNQFVYKYLQEMKSNFKTPFTNVYPLTPFIYGGPLVLLLLVISAASDSVRIDRLYTFFEWTLSLTAIFTTIMFFARLDGDKPFEKLVESSASYTSLELVLVFGPSVCRILHHVAKGSWGAVIALSLTWAAMALYIVARWEMQQTAKNLKN